jgi:Fur family zinc uptake transcriptional regulator
MTGLNSTNISASYNFSLTPLRKKILSLFIKNKRPLKAYEIISTINNDRNTKPIVIYRILNFFVEKKLLHKIQSKNSFILCENHLCTEKKGINIFLSCNNCKNVLELENLTVLDNIKTLCSSKEFDLVESNIELDGYCSNCKSK